MDSDDEHEESAKAYRGIPATIILINVYDLKTAEIAHTATCRMIRQYLRPNRSRYVGVCLFGTELNNNETLRHGDQNVLDIFPLTLPTVEDYKKLQKTKMETVKPDTELKMSNALSHCIDLFAICKKQLSTRTIIILQRLDTPPIQSDQMLALKKVEDLADSNFSVDIKLVNVCDTDNIVDDFYMKFLINANKGKDVTIPKPIWDVQEIEKLMYQESHRHLAVSRLSFEIGSGLSIGVGVYNLLRDSRQSQKTAYLDGDSGDIVTPVTETLKVTMDNNPMEIDAEVQPKEVPLLKSEVIYSQEYGGERVEFTDTEMKYLKNPFGPPMLKLIGFKPASSLSKEKWFLKKGYFLFPNESIIEGSTIAFKALHQACVKTGVVAICILCTRVNSRPMNVALAPCTHPLGLDIDTGFDVIIIPFVENVRNLPEVDDVNDITDSHKTVMMDTINALKFDYKADMFEDPKLQSLHINLEGLALDKEEIEPFVDTTKPSSEKFNDLDDDLFQEIFGPFGSVALKRPTASKDNGNSKKVKTEEIDESLLQSRLANQKINQYTVAQLKDVLKSKDIPELPALTGLKKAELVELIYKHF